MENSTKPLQQQNQSSPTCENLPSLLSSFVDTFIDFSVSGLFLPQQQQTPQKALQTHIPSPDRLVAIGDLHGDLEKSKQAFRLAGLIDGSDRWSGGSATVVQIGDVLDRGGEELKILYFLDKLKREAVKSGGQLITLNGNHEIMNVEGDFRYVTEKGLEEFNVWAYWYGVGNKMKSLCHGLEKPKDPFHGIPLSFRGVAERFYHSIRARIAALRPDGPIARRFLADNLTVLVVGESVFVHGGLLEKHVDYGLERINEEVRDWINGLMGRRAPGYCKGRNAVVWLRKFSDELAKNCDCSLLEHVLATIPGAKRMIMGHTIQEIGINGACDNRAIRIDVGMSKGCINGLPEVLEINRNSELRVLTSNPMYQNKNKSYANAERKEGLGLLIPENGPKQVEVKA
ncbi:PREDICTED: shewanella-like protein phosphatase 2 [Theobroma cacao]|uniref:Shewanella-like protein phosphatase 2 n=1 Tax=Theobroma cacao TaxID=3641 RepID=A0AB32V7D7_THECC|nr:PREDICTED: shewanella-like protein phosphatase 2 [Theobroma cacao]